MKRKLFFLVVSTTVLVGACKEEMVGAPCVPETDNGTFNVAISGETWSIETGSVQCATNLCLTQVRPNPMVSSTRKAECAASPSVENCWIKRDDQGNIIGEPVQLKFSFCSCRCRDAEGHVFSDNPDKYYDLCECPPSTVCVDVLDPIEGISDKLPGGYCVPECIKNPCSNEDGVKICTPSKDSKEPWKWHCADPPAGYVAGQPQ